jgi:peptidoglycan hydrolase-like protein with peptidoglycan-binding domain
MLWLTDPRTIGEQVVDLQEGLAMAGYFESQIDGVFGPATDAAVRRFQAAQGMKVNGIVDLAVWMALGRVCEDIAVRLSEPLTDLMSTPAVHSGPQQGGPTAASPKASPDASPDASLTRTGWRAILVDTSDLTLTVLEDGRPIHQFRVGVGAPSTPTPLGQYRIIGKAAWAGGFGSRWMGLNVPWGKFGIHGTNKPWTVGRRKSSGCVRMFNRDVEKLYALVDVGTPVVIIGGMLRYLGSRRQTIRPGVKAGHVIEVQKCLIELGYISGPPDGVYGPGTEKAIMRLQKDRGLPVTGIVDGPTYDALGLYAFE